MSKNDITGDEIKSKLNTADYERNYESIFRRVADDKVPTNQPVQLILDFPDDESRINTIGQNGNDGLHYEGIND